MVARSRVVLGAVALLVVAPLGAVVVISSLLLFGVKPRLVFLPGFFVMSQLEAHGFHVVNAVGVVSTVVLWWGIIVIVWLAVRRLWKTKPS